MRGASAKHVDEYVATVHDHLRATLQEAQAQSMTKAQWQKWYYDQNIGAMDLKPGNLVLMNANAFQGKREIKDRWEDKPNKVVHQIATYVPSYEVKDQHSHASYTATDPSSLHQKLAFPCVWVSMKHRTDVPAPP